MKKQRQLTDHKVNGLNEAISIFVLDDPGQGGANHSYQISVPYAPGATDEEHEIVEINFQNGPVQEVGVNGISNESLLSVLIDRIRGFQYCRNAAGDFCQNAPGKFACRENAIALSHLEDALMWLQKRTRARMTRGVEGEDVA